MAVYCLPQTDTSLLGAAQLAAGCAFIDARGAELVAFQPSVAGMPEKYARWKVWLDARLLERPAGAESQVLR
jgi:hypothetical protein